MPQLIDLDATDVLTDVLSRLKLRGRVFCCSELTAPWSMSLDKSDFAHFHVIEEGEAWLMLGRSSVRLGTGDLIVVPHGKGHVLSDSRNTPPASLKRLMRGRTSNGCHLMRHGGGGARTLMTCGSFRFESSFENPLLAVLPEVIHIRGNQDGVREWLEPTLSMLTWEARNPRSGSQTMIDRLTDIIFVQAVRLWVDSQPAAQAGWLGALRDRQIGTALQLIHREPARDWSVSSLAVNVAMSRSPFAARFTQLVGEPPLSYITRWRMHLAANLLTDDDLTLSEIAERVGYDSEAAFSKAFKRRFGLAPGAYRRANSSQGRVAA